MISNQFDTELKNKRSIICCSAGADSTYLAHLISEHIPMPHILLYINHQQRPKEIDNEIDHVHTLGKALNKKVIVKSIQTGKQTSQEYFRDERIRIINELCKAEHIQTVFSGHHLNDDIETIIVQLLKGSTYNLAGIPKKTEFKNFTMYHPLLAISKEEIIQSLTHRNIKFCHDSSNDTDKYTRNKNRPIIETLLSINNSKPHTIKNSIDYLKSNQKKLQNKSQKLNVITMHNNICFIKKTPKLN